MESISATDFFTDLPCFIESLESEIYHKSYLYEAVADRFQAAIVSKSNF